MSLVARGMGSPGGLITTTGVGRIIAVIAPLDAGGGGTVPHDTERYQVTIPRIYIRPKKSISDILRRPAAPAHDIEIKTGAAVYPVSFEAIPTVSAAIRMDQNFKTKVGRAAKELGVSRRKARSALRSRVIKELRSIRALRDTYLDDDDILEILIIAGII